MELYKKVRLYRLSNGIKQKFIAQKTGLSDKKINSIEMGRQKLTTEDFENICINGLKVDPAIFFTDKFLDIKNLNKEICATTNPDPAA